MKAAAAAELHEIHDVLKVFGISKRVAHTRLIDNKRFNSLKDFGVMDGETGVMDMVKLLDSMAVANCANLGTVQIKGLQYLVWWIHNCQTHNQMLITDEFGQVTKRAAVTGKHIDTDMAETDAKVVGLDKSKAEEFDAAEDGIHKPLYQKK